MSQENIQGEYIMSMETALNRDMYKAYCETLRGALNQIKDMVTKNPDKNTDSVVYVIKQALYFTS